MTPTRKRRMYMILIIALGVSTAVALMLTAFNQNVMFFYDPSQIAAGEVPVDRPFRVGGMVVEGSVSQNGTDTRLLTRFDLTDYQQSVTVEYDKILPDLFREGQGIVAIGKLDSNGLFIADEVLAKHDETYMPPEVAASLKGAPEAE